MRCRAGFVFALSAGGGRLHGLFPGRGTREEIPGEPCGGSPKIERRYDSNQTNFDVGEKNEQGKRSKQITRAGRVCAVEDCRNCQALIVEPTVRRGQKGNQYEQAAVCRPIPYRAARPEIEDGPNAANCGGQILQPHCPGGEPMADRVGKARDELIFDGRGSHHACVISPGLRVD